MLMLAIILSFCYGNSFINFCNLSGTSWDSKSKKWKEDKKKKTKYLRSLEFSSQGHAPVKPEEHDSKIAKMAS